MKLSENKPKSLIKRALEINEDQSDKDFNKVAKKKLRYIPYVNITASILTLLSPYRFETGFLAIMCIGICTGMIMRNVQLWRAWIAKLNKTKLLLFDLRRLKVLYIHLQSLRPVYLTWLVLCICTFPPTFLWD